MLRSCVVLLSVVCFGFLSVAAASAVQYNYTELLPLSGNNYSWGFDVARVGSSTEVVGSSFTGTWTPTVWINGTATSLLPCLTGAAAGANDWAHAINGNGDIAGQTHVGGVQKAFFVPAGLAAGSGIILPTLGGSTGGSCAFDVNNSGTVVGYSAAADGYGHAFVWSQSTGIVDLGTSGHISWASAISPDGNTIVGSINSQAQTGTTDQQGQLAIWTKSGSTWTLSTPIPLTTYNQSTACAINSSGDIVGSYFNYAQGGFPSTTQLGLYLPHTGGTVLLGDMTLLKSYGRGINDSGVIAGSDGAFNNGIAWVDYNGTAAGKTNLNTLLAAGSNGFNLTAAYAVDNSGDITGISAKGASYHAYVLAPVPEPSTLLLTATGLLGLVACAWRKRK